MKIQSQSSLSDQLKELSEILATIPFETPVFLNHSLLTRKDWSGLSPDELSNLKTGARIANANGLYDAADFLQNEIISLYKV